MPGNSIHSVVDVEPQGNSILSEAIQITPTLNSEVANLPIRCGDDNSDNSVFLSEVNGFLKTEIGHMMLSPRLMMWG